MGGMDEWNEWMVNMQVSKYIIWPWVVWLSWLSVVSLQTEMSVVSGHMPRLQARSLVGGTWEGVRFSQTSMFLSLSVLSLPSPLSKQIKPKKVLEKKVWHNSKYIIW